MSKKTQELQEAVIRFAGHSIDDNEPKYGLVVSGEVDEIDLIRNTGAQPGDALILTKPLGTGIISTAIKKGLCSDPVIDTAVESMSTLNKLAANEMKKYEVHAATDVTGFGLLGHLKEVCQASNVSCILDSNSIFFLEGAEQLASKDIVPGGSKRNLKHAKGFTSFSEDISTTKKSLREISLRLADILYPPFGPFTALMSPSRPICCNIFAKSC